MSITKEEASKIKEHLLNQLENFPEDKRSQIKEQIMSMTTKQVEEFIKQNELNHLGGQCIFCSIVAKKTPSYKIAEDRNYISILEINPLSKGHSLIVPKEHLDKIPASSENMIRELSGKLQRAFSPKEIRIKEINMMGHALLEVVPIYGDETQRKQASQEELKYIQNKILETKEIKKPIKLKKIPIIPPRIP